MRNVEALARNFLTFAEKECKGSSPLYESLSRKIAADDELLGISGKAGKGQPIPNILFGAVHYLLLKGKDHPLKEFYPSIVSDPKPHEAAFQPFKDFFLMYRDEVEDILQTRLVQTNEVRRCAYLYPVFCIAYEKAQKPLTLIEIGTSAGLQLLWDKYAYSYKAGTRGQSNCPSEEAIYGSASSRLHLTTEIKGGNIPTLHATPPPVAARIGMDLNTVDLNDEEEKLWLKALIWPEHKERLAMFENAAGFLKEVPISLYDGDGISILPLVVDGIPEETAICIFHTHVANQLPAEEKEQLLQYVEVIGRERDVFHIYNNVHDKYLHLDYYLEGTSSKHTVAETDGHGRWFRWLMNP